ncbi:probable protein phosphatase 2C 34 [Punica granatum]|uniref:protein-serine/threonine phosphatase n=2 Tax=Punica granatum TaxID=22663 RepID=A0A218XU09_PUNGR|nr:probable protein phosphatase 2C 34 [Punica granatum]OWM88136.1 hypothetical protein CDL15_Pgr016709 [Punica granatum]PKI56726.1 hypothetical protein CRG98_022886 [Punica granatum]
MTFFPYLLEGLARTVSIKRSRSYGNDVGREAAIALAKEARRNELVLSSTGTIRNNKSSKFTSVCSKRGNKGINQDSFVVWEDYGFQEDMMFCGIFDGHGPWGHVVAKQVRQLLPSALLCNWQETIALRSPSEDPEADFESLSWFEIWKQSYLKTYAAMDLELKHNRRIDSYHSGTTALTIVKQGDHLIIANIGDCRAVLATTSDHSSLLPIQLTVDFKPDLPQEAERITQSRGKVSSSHDEPGVYRVWNPNGETPGFAISRAFGDYCVKEYGLISVPDVTHRKISSQDQFVILATDGVWDVISNKEAVRIVSSAPDREKSAKRLVECAAQEWKRKRRGFAVDDISAICLFFDAAWTQAANYSLKVTKELSP